MIDFASMQVGDEATIPQKRWEEVRPIYEACIDYVRSVKPAPQFEFAEGKKTSTPGVCTWIVRRVR